MSINALLIGCGNVGAQYDLGVDNKVWTHAKAYSLIDDLCLTVFDTDADKASKVAARYNAKALEKIDENNINKFDVISITTPTPTHFNYLTTFLPQSPSVIICEKPVVSSSAHADELISLYHNSHSRVLINYMRRFQPGFLQLRQELRNDFSNKNPNAFIIKYNRGFLNNAGHAVDLLEFLFDEQFDFLNLLVQKVEFDAFDYDPTVTASCLFLDAPVTFVGLTSVEYSVFEIEIFYADSKIVICHSGNEIRYYCSKEKSLQESERQTNILDKYMIPVMNEALDLFWKRKSSDNFIAALNLNSRMLNILESLKIRNATVSH